MSSTATTIRVLTPVTAVAPRGATLVGALYDAYVAYRRYRAAAGRRAELSRDAEAVRKHAALIEGSDPGMAADLRAAADRHA